MSPYLPRSSHRAPRLAAAIADDLRRQIFQGRLHEGEQLPPEGVLANDFAVSKPIMREALRMLEAEDLLRIRRGSGGGPTIVSPTTSAVARQAGIVLQHKGTSILDLYGALQIIETAVVRIVATSCTKEDLAELEAIQRAAEEEGSVADDRDRDAHVEFHRTLVRITRNDALVLVTNVLYDILQSHPLHTHGGVFDRTGSTELMTKNATVVHRQVLDLIRARRPRAAEAMWQKHVADAIAQTSEVFANAVVDIIGDSRSQRVGRRDNA